MATQRLAFGPFVLDLVDERLWRDGRALRLGYKSHAVLRHLATNAGRLVRKEELLAAVWADTHVSPAVLKVCVCQIRQALGEEPSTPRYIETVRPRGYRFIAPVQEASAAPPLGSAAPDPRAPSQGPIVQGAAGWVLAAAPDELGAPVPRITRRTIDRAQRAWDESLRLAREAEALHSTAAMLRQRSRQLREQRAAERLRWAGGRRVHSGPGHARSP